MWICVYMPAYGVVRNLWPFNVIRERTKRNSSPRVFTLIQTNGGLCSFNTLGVLFVPVCVCVVTWFPDCCRDSLPFVHLVHGNWNVFTIYEEGQLWIRKPPRLGFVFSCPPVLGDINSYCIPEKQAPTFTQHFSIFIFLSLYTPFYSPLKLSSLVYHSLYSLESPYTTAKSQEPDCFHVLGFYCRFPVSLMWILSTQHVDIDVWEESNVSFFETFQPNPS